MTDFIFLGSKITADGGLSHGENTVTNILDSILKSTDITLPTKVSHIVKAMVFPVVIYECESWTTKKAECLRIDAFELWCWRRPLDCKEIQPVHPKGNQDIEYSLEGLMLKLKLQYLATSCEELTHWKRP